MKNIIQCGNSIKPIRHAGYGSGRLAVIGLIAVAIIYNMTGGGFGSVTDKLGGTINSVNEKL